MTKDAALPDLLLESLAGHAIWRRLTEADRLVLADRFEITGHAGGDILLEQGRLHSRVGLILSGAVDMQDPDLSLSIRLDSGEMFGFGATPSAQLATWQGVASSECQVAWLRPEALKELCKAHGELAYFFPSLAAPQTSSTPHEDDSPPVLSMPLRKLIKRAPITVAPDASIHAAAQLMHQHKVSSVLLLEQSRLAGLVTDRDLRNRVVAQALDITRPVSDIATLSPMTLDARQPAFDALLLMARQNIHHVPVTDGKQVIGMVTATDLTEQHSTSAVFLAGDIYKQSSVEALTQVSAKIKLMQQQLAAADTSAYSTGHLMTAMTDALTVRLIQLAQEELGPAPVDYVWVAAGSQARNEQTAKSDQDNCMILDDSYDEALHGDYFRQFSRFVCDGLAACGYIHCPGEMMAMTDTWRQPRKQWERYFSQWVNKPEPKALMLTCVFFDLRAIHGNSGLLETLRREVLQRTRGNSIFLAYMVGNALKHRPPLGLFGNISLIRSGDNAGTIDLKHTGVVPIVDLARVYALAGAEEAVNTQDRLEVAARAGEVSEQSARDLRDAFEFLSKLRIAHQAHQTAQGRAADNFLTLDELSNFERSHLKEAFSVVQTLQGVLGQRYR